MERQTENFTRHKALASELDLSDVERRYFEGGRVGKHWVCERIELNAMTPAVFIEYLERKLQEAAAYEKALGNWVTENGSKLLGFGRIADALTGQLRSSVCQSSAESVALAFAQDRTLSWRAVVDRAIVLALQGQQDELMESFIEDLELRVLEMVKR